MIASVRHDLALVEVLELLRIAPCPGSIPSIFFIEPMLLSCCIWSRKSSSVKVSVASFSAIFMRLVLVEGLLRLLDEGEDVAEVEDPARHAVGVERLEVVEALAGGREDDRAAGDRGDRQGRATARVAVELRQHDAGEVDALLEGLGGVRPRPGRSSRR